MEKNEAASIPTAFLVDLVSNRKIPITTPRCRVGRDDLNDIVISGDQSISRFHFIITFENGQYQVQDAKSRHGTFLNGNQIGGPEPINDGDVLKIGVSLFWFVIESQAGTEKEEPQPPVDVAKAASAEEVSMKKGGDFNYAAEVELSATQEISIISPEALAQFGLTQSADNEAEPAEDEKGKSETKKDEKPEPETDSKSEPESKKKKKNKDEEKAEEPKSDSKEAPESKADKETPAKADEEAQTAEEKSESKEDDKQEEEPAQAADSEESPKDDSKSEEDSKSGDQADKAENDAEPTENKDSEAKDDVEIAVKELLEPLQNEIEASREMIRDALKKGDLKSEDKDEEEEKEEKAESQKEEAEEQAEKTDSEEEPASKSDDEKDEGDEEDSKPESTGDEDEDEPESSEKKDNGPDEKSQEAETLEKIAEIIDDSSKSGMAEKGDEHPGVSADSIQTELSTDHDKASNGIDEDMTTVSQMGPTNVPDWCKKYFSDELKHLNKELDSLNEQIRQYQEKIRKIEGQAALTKGLRNTLLTAEGDDLIEACKKVLGMAGWKVTQSEEDKHEFLLEHEDEKVLIARVISIKGAAERSHLGQLSISQTRFWCEKGIEPKGVLIVGKVSDKAPKDRGEETNEEVVEYANMKNVCIMNTLQLLALYRDIALKEGKATELRSSIHESKGWLKGFDIEPGDEIIEDEDKESNKSKSLSSLLSA